MRLPRISSLADRMDLVHLACILQSLFRVNADLFVFVIKLAIGHVHPVRSTETLSQSVADQVSDVLGGDNESFGTELLVNLHRNLAESDGRAASESDAHD